MQFADLNGQILHFQEMGAAPDKPTLVFVNSLGTDFRIWRDVIVRLAGEFKMITYDMRGHGLSEAGDDMTTIEDHVWDLAALLDHTKVENAYICGLSMGGLVAQGLHAARPELVRGLILCGTAHKIGDPDDWEERMDVIAEEGIASVADQIVGRWFTPDFASGNPEVAGYRTMLERQNKEGYLQAINAVVNADMTDIAREIDVPTLCICGAEDAVTNPNHMAEFSSLIEDSTLEVIEGAAHLMNIEQAEQVATLIQNFAGKKTDRVVN